MSDETSVTPEQLRGLLRRIRDDNPVRDYCEEPPVCIGTGEGNGDLLVACDECCGHGDDDGWCLMLEADDEDAD